MVSWVAVSYGALDVDAHSFGGGGYRFLVAPVRPGMPVMLMGVGATVWQRLVKGPVAESDLDTEALGIVEEMERMGIASREAGHEARVFEVVRPWLSSPIHELVYAILGRVADSAGIDIVFVKGPTLHAQGLRTREHSGDVDCWVAPGKDVQFARAMEPWGWRPAISAFTSTPVLHSLTLRAPEWACAVDVHAWFPGMTVTPDEAFRQLLESSEQRSFAGYVAKTPVRSLHAVISALHDVRPFGAESSAGGIDRAANTLSRGGESTASAVVSFGAEFALKEAFSRAFPALPLDFENARVPADWSWRSQPTVLRAYVAALRVLPLGQRLRTIFRVIWPSAESLRAGPFSLEVGSSSVSRLRARRAARGFQELASAIRRKSKA